MARFCRYRGCGNRYSTAVAFGNAKTRLLRAETGKIIMGACTHRCVLFGRFAPILTPEGTNNNTTSTATTQTKLQNVQQSFTVGREPTEYTNNTVCVQSRQTRSQNSPQETPIDTTGEQIVFTTVLSILALLLRLLLDCTPRQKLHPP